MMDIWRQIGGMMEVEIASASIESALAFITENNIELYNVVAKDELTITCVIQRRDYPRVKNLCQRRGDSLRLCAKSGMYWYLRGFLCRPLCLLGICILIFATIVIPKFVFFVQVEGNHNISTLRILESAELCGIRFGATRGLVRSERVKNALLYELPQLQWAGVNTNGCVATISVREKPETASTEQDPVLSSVAASRDGVILSCTANQGNLLCQEGQAVRQGDILISPYTMCGNRIQISAPEGEVFAQTQWSFTAIVPKQWYQKGPAKEIRRHFTLLLGKKRINLWKDSGISDTSCGRMYAEYYIILPGGYQLPLGLAIDTNFYGPAEMTHMAKNTAQRLACDFTQQYLLSQMIAGEILDQQFTHTETETEYLCYGYYRCCEMIGRKIPEKIGELYEQTD